MQTRWTPALCFLQQSYLLPAPNNEYVTGSMTIDNKKNYADVHVRSGLYSSDTIFDYQHVSKSKNLPRI